MMKKKTSLYIKVQRKGYLFMIPFLAGFALLYAMPLIRSLIFSFSSLTNYGEGVVLEFVAWGNYKYVLMEDPNFIVSVTESLRSLLISVPSVILFSFFFSCILNQKFKGRVLARTIMFLPVVMTSGVVALMQSDVFTQNAASVIAGRASTGIQNAGISDMTMIILDLLPFQGSAVEAFIEASVDQVYNIVVSSGVQILIFIAGLQNIAPSLFEASSIEGATSWQSFWKITFPMISPLILVNVVYTLVDQMCGFSNQITQVIYGTTFYRSEFGVAAAMSWVYLAIVIFIMAAVVGIINKFVYYEN